MKDLMEILKQLKNVDQTLQAIQSLNGNKPFLRIGNKVVVEYNNEIYRIEDTHSSYKRQLLRDYALSLGLDLFLEETILPEYSNKIWRVTKQQKINVLTNITDKSIFQYFDESQHEVLENFLKETGIFGFGHNNCGLLNNKFYAYDYIDNCTCIYTHGKWRLFGDHMKELFAIDGEYV